MNDATPGGTAPDANTRPAAQTVLAVSTVPAVTAVPTAHAAPAVSTGPAAAAVVSTLPPRAAKLMAIEILLADPESLGDDILESCLYILREKLRSA